MRRHSSSRVSSSGRVKSFVYFRTSELRPGGEFQFFVAENGRAWVSATRDLIGFLGGCGSACLCFCDERRKAGISP